MGRIQMQNAFRHPRTPMNGQTLALIAIQDGNGSQDEARNDKLPHDAIKGGRFLLGQKGPKIARQKGKQDANDGIHTRQGHHASKHVHGCPLFGKIRQSHVIKGTRLASQAAGRSQGAKEPILVIVVIVVIGVVVIVIVVVVEGIVNGRGRRRSRFALSHFYIQATRRIIIILLRIMVHSFLFCW